MADPEDPFVEIGPQAPPRPPSEFEEAVDVSFFVPCLNEEQQVAGTIARLASVCAGLGLSYEILVFDDGSKDRTVEVAKNY